MINTQRYKDSVRTLQSFMQQQYNLTYNVENGRGVDLNCNNSDVVDAVNNGIPRGQTDCVVMGRYVLINEEGAVEVSSIVGQEPAANTVLNSDLEAFDAWNPKRVSQKLGLTDNELTLPWGALLVGTAGSSDPRSVAVAVIRSPLTGTVHTYSIFNLPDSTAPPNVADMLTVANEDSDLNLCLDPGTFVAGGRMGVRLRSFASTQDSVQLIEDGSGTC